MPNVKELSFDRVHDTQYIYRQLLDVIARPGQISSIAPALSKMNADTPLAAMAACFALTLLDGEVSFAVAFAEEREELESYIRRQTFSRIQPVWEADYVVAAGNMEADQVKGMLAQVKKGSLIRPEGGAMLFVLVEGLEPAMCEDGACWTLSGPGIKDTCTLCVQGLSLAWMEGRAEANAEYPMGIDLVLFTLSGEIAALPRTTIVKGACS